MSLTAGQKNLLRQVIAACREGRYLHGNGAIWTFTKVGDPKTVVTIDHVHETIKESNAKDSETYLRSNHPRRDENTAKSLETFIK